MEVVHDVLDKPVVDRNGREMGRVDGIVLRLTTGQPPRLSAILIGASVLGYRLHWTLGRLLGALEYLLGLNDVRPIRVNFEDVTETGQQVKVTHTVGDTAADALERRVRQWLLKIPGA